MDNVYGLELSQCREHAEFFIESMVVKIYCIGRKVNADEMIDLLTKIKPYHSIDGIINNIGDVQ